MMDKNEQIKNKKANQAINLFEEIIWLLSSKKLNELKDAPQLLRSLLENNIESTISDKYRFTNKNKNVLIGILPNLFQDTNLFKMNTDLSDFGASILNITITRAEKRSRYEIIGLLICQIANIDDNLLEVLVNALSRIAGNEDAIKLIEKEKEKSNFSWSETIQKYNTI